MILRLVARVPLADRLNPFRDSRKCVRYYPLPSDAPSVEFCRKRGIKSLSLADIELWRPLLDEDGIVLSLIP